MEYRGCTPANGGRGTHAICMHGKGQNTYNTYSVKTSVSLETIYTCISSSSFSFGCSSSTSTTSSGEGPGSPVRKKKNFVIGGGKFKLSWKLPPYIEVRKGRNLLSASYAAATSVYPMVDLMT